jgi:hypothetical protein
VHGRVRRSDGQKGALKHRCEEEGPERFHLAHPAVRCNGGGAWLGVGDGTYFGMSDVHEVRKLSEGGVRRRHSGEDIGLLDGIGWY